MSLTLNVQRLVADLGGPSVAARYLTNRGFDVSIKTVSAWQTRNSLPMEAWIRICGIVLADSGKRLNLWKYLEVNQ
jgi:hypothetical protein